MDWFNTKYSSEQLRRLFVEMFTEQYGVGPVFPPMANRCTFAAGLEKLAGGLSHE